MKFLLTLVLFFSVLFIYFYPRLMPLSTVKPNYIYLGQNSFFDPWDVNLYVSAIRYGQRGEIMLENLYTAEPNTPVFIYTPLVFVGAVFNGVNPFLLFHIAGLISGLTLLFTMTYSLIVFGFSYMRSVLIAALVSLAGGFGFLLQKLNPADITSSAFTFYSTFQKPHEAIAVGALILVYALFYRFIQSKPLERKYATFIVIGLWIALFIYPYFLLSFLISQIAYVLTRRKNPKKDLARLIIVLVPVLPVALFSAYQFIKNPTFADVGSNMRADFVSFALGYGLIFILVAVYLKSQKTELGKYLLAWFFTVFVLSLLPIGPGKIFLRASFFPAVIISILCLENFTKNLKRIDPFFIYAIFTLISISTSISIFLGRVSNGYTNNPWTFMREEEYGVLKFLEGKTQKDETVFTYFRLSNQIPAFTNNRVYLGHLLQTPDSSEKEAKAFDFVAGEGSTGSKREFVVKNNIDYVVWGAEEEEYFKKSSGGNKVKDLLMNSREVYSTGGFVVYDMQK